MSNILSKICSIPRDFYTYQDKSVIQLFSESGYLENPKSITKERLMDYLEANPDLIKDWENYSSNKRVSQGWYFLEEKPKWIVGYASVPSQEYKQAFNSAVEACSEFILHELEEWAKHATRR